MSLVKKNKAERASFFIVFFVGMVLLFAALINPPKRVGDAHEYVLMQESLLRHASVELRTGDLDALDRIVQQYPGFSLDGITEVLRSEINNNDNPSSGYIVKNSNGIPLGYVASNTGEWYSIHFFLYSLIAIPVRLLLLLVGANPLLSFQIINAIAVFLVVFYIYFRSSLSVGEKHLVSALYLLSGTTYYLFWVHPEVFTSSLLLVSLLAFLDKRYVLSAFCASFASMQNPPVAFFIPFVFLFYVRDSWERNRAAFWYGILKDMSMFASILLAGIMSLFPSFFYWLVLGHPNPIVLVGSADYNNVSLSRFLSLWFDLNQGVILGDFGLYIGLTMVSLILVLRKMRGIEIREAFVSLFILCAAIVLSIPCLTTGNWNSGSSTFIRYGYWLVMMPIVSFVILSRNMDGSFRSALMAGVIMIQVGIVFANKIIGNGIPPSRFTGISKSVMYHFPEWYNPVPEIFAERSYGTEHDLDRNRVYYFEKKQKITKLLLHESKTLPVEIKDSTREYIPAGGFSRVDALNGWYYLNGVFENRRLVAVEPNIPVGFDSELVDWTDWSSPEAGWRWSEGHHCSVRFSVSEYTAAHGMMLQIFLGPLGKRQRISISINNAERFFGELEKESIVVVPLRSNDLLADRNNIVQFYLPDARQPDGGKDMRILGVYIRWFKIVAEE